MNINITVDPHNKFNHVPSEIMLEQCGLLLHWLEHGPQEFLKDRLISAYVFYVGPMEGGTLRVDGTYIYPQDPDLYPIVSFEVADEICFIYEYGIVGVFNKSDGSTWVTRMD